ncbi:MAG: 5'-nucleotidase C-terminal domain-containing protein, partial [Syntrophomonas sp.]
ASPKVISACKIDKPGEIITRLVPELKQQGVQVIIILGHLGGYMDNDKNTITGEVAELTNAISGADVLVAAHTDQKIAGYINGMAVVQAYYNGRAVGHIALKYSPQAQKVVSAIPAVIDLPTPNLTEDIQVKAIIDEGQKQLGPVKNEIIGENSTELSHQRDKFSILGQWVTDIMRQETNADIAFQNGGGLRTGIPAGVITVGKLWEVLPFDNTLVLLDMKGSQIMQALQYGINNSMYGSLQYSGVKVKYDPLLPSDERIVEVTLPDGSVFNPEKTYRVVTNDFMAGGGDGYIMFKEGSNVTDTHRLVRDVLINFIKKIKVINFKGDNRLWDNGTGYKQESNIQIYQPDQTPLARVA